MGERKKLKDNYMLSSMNLLETKWFAQFKFKNMKNCKD